MKYSEIKPCPFCGGKVKETRGVLNAPFCFYKCSNPKCGAVMSFDNFAANTVPIKARENYNRRASDEQLQ